MKIRYQWYS